MTTVACPLCALVLNAHALTRHVGKRRCTGRQKAETLFSQGLYPVEFMFQAKSDHAAEALRQFGLSVELHDTRGRNANSESGGRHLSNSGNEAWTSEDGVALALIIEEAARLLAVSYPEAARRLHRHRELIGPFGVAWRLGQKKDPAVFEVYYDPMLREILQPIDYVLGSDGKQRVRKP